MSFRAKTLPLDFMEIIWERMSDEKTRPECIADLLGVNIKQLEHLFNGQKQITFEMIAKLEEYFNIKFTVDYYKLG